MYTLIYISLSFLYVYVYSNNLIRYRYLGL